MEATNGDDDWKGNGSRWSGKLAIERKMRARCQARLTISGRVSDGLAMEVGSEVALGGGTPHR